MLLVCVNFLTDLSPSYLGFWISALECRGTGISHTNIHEFVVLLLRSTQRTRWSVFADRLSLTIDIKSRCALVVSSCVRNCFARSRPLVDMQLPQHGLKTTAMQSSGCPTTFLSETDKVLARRLVPMCLSDGHRHPGAGNGVLVEQLLIRLRTPSHGDKSER